MNEEEFYKKMEFADNFRRTLRELGDTVPKFCPHCGERLIGITDDGEHFWIVPAGKQNNRVDTFDVYCNSCEWSGDIAPDSLDEYYEMKKQEAEE